MSDNKFKNKYRIASTRLAGYDYAQEGSYFITVCVKDRRECLGEVQNGGMKLSVLGSVVDGCWREIPKHFPFVILDEYVVMPNHIHGILEINKSVETQNLVSPSFAKNNFASQFCCLSETETQNLASLRNKFGPQSRNLASIIRGFKIGVTKYARNNNLLFDWQERFYEHIIRNERSLNNIRRYILGNPIKWATDRNNSINLLM